MRAHRQNQSGQVGLIIILISVVLLTIGLSVAMQSTKEVFLANQEDESTRILNAAEAGVDQALATDLAAQTGSVITGTADVPGANATVNYQINKLTTLTTRMPEGSTATVKLADLGATPAVTGLIINWGKEGDCSQKPASLIVEVFSFDTIALPQTSVRYLALLPYGCDYDDDFTTTPGITETAGENGYFSKATIPIGSKDTLVRIKPFYNDTNLDVVGVGGTLPVQSYVIQSTAVNQLSAQNETRSIIVNRTLSSAPSVMDYAVFSGTSVVK